MANASTWSVAMLKMKIVMTIPRIRGPLGMPWPRSERPSKAHNSHERRRPEEILPI
jgi:hypothetical protein